MFKAADLYLLAPEISLVVLALAVMVIDLFVKRRIFIVATSLIGLIVPLGFVLAQAFSTRFNTPQTAFFGMFIVDRYSLFFDVLFLIIAAVLILSSDSYISKNVKAEGEFYMLLLFSVTGMLFMAGTD